MKKLNTIAKSNNLRKAKPRRRGFNLVEMLIALAITGALLGATMVALQASFMAYQTTTEVASTHTISRLIMNRMLTLIRTGQEFGPFPVDPQDSIVISNEIQFFAPNGDLITLRWEDASDTLFVVLTDGPQHRGDDAGFHVDLADAVIGVVADVEVAPGVEG